VNFIEVDLCGCFLFEVIANLSMFLALCPSSKAGVAQGLSKTQNEVARKSQGTIQITLNKMGESAEENKAAEERISVRSERSNFEPS